MQGFLRRMAVLAWFLPCLLIMPVIPAQSASTVEVKAAQQKINLSGRQRMLSQRMAAAACMVVAGIDVENRSQVALGAHDSFERALRGLEYGDPGLHLTPETFPEILSSLRHVDQIWGDVSPAVRQIVAGDMHSVVIGQLLRLNVPLLKTSNTAVTGFVKRYGADVLDPHSATTINVAGRQRMLSQKMMKEACFVSVGLNAAGNLAALKETIKLFHTSLNSLLNGSTQDQIIEPPNALVVGQLSRVRQLWNEYQTVLEQIQIDGAENYAHLQQLAPQSDLVLKEMNKAVQMYVASTR